jgi:hypothetical protein
MKGGSLPCCKPLAGISSLWPQMHSAVTKSPGPRFSIRASYRGRIEIGAARVADLFPREPCLRSYVNGRQPQPRPGSQLAGSAHRLRLVDATNGDARACLAPAPPCDEGQQHQCRHDYVRGQPSQLIQRHAEHVNKISAKMWLFCKRYGTVAHRSHAAMCAAQSRR